MNHRVNIIIWLLVGGLAASLHARSYSLEELVQSGYTSSKQVKMVQEELTKTDAQIREAYGNAFPKIDLSANYSYTIEAYSPYGDMSGTGSSSISSMLPQDSTVTMSDRIIAGAIDGMMSGLAELMATKDQAIALSVSLQQPLFAQGKVSIGLAIARVYKESLQAKYEAARQGTRADITKLYYATLMAQKNAAIQDEAIKLAQETHRLAKVRFGLGKSSELDTLISRLNLAKTQMDQTKAQSGLRMAKEVLMKQAGLPETAGAFDVTGEFPASDYSMTLDAALENMKKNNRQLQQLESGGKVQDLLVKLSRTDYQPMVYCGGSYSQITQFNAGDDIEWGDQAKVFVGMSMNLFNGGITGQKVKQALSSRRTFDETKALASDGLELGVKNAYENLETSRQGLMEAANIVTLASKGYELSKKTYEVGMGTLLDMQKAELELKGAKMMENAAQFSFHSAVVDLKTVMGVVEP